MNHKGRRESEEELGFNADKTNKRLAEIGKEPKDGRLVWKDEIGGDVEFKVE